MIWQRDEDKSSDYVPSAESDTGEEPLVWELEQLECFRRLLEGSLMRHIGISDKNRYAVELICEGMTYNQRGQLLTKKKMT